MVRSGCFDIGLLAIGGTSECLVEGESVTGLSDGEVRF
jgi:hypothetical protein